MCRFGTTELQITGPIKTWTVVDRAHLISVPTLCIIGADDQFQEFVMFPFYEKIPNVKHICFEESSHMPMLEERGRFMDTVATFLIETS